MKKLKIVLLALALALTFSICDCDDSQLHPDFYNSSCPKVEEIVMSVVREAVAKETRMAASSLRLHFHDCFVQGCDGSVLLDSIGGIVSEKNSNPNNNSIRGFDVIDDIKTALEDACPGTVSCTDVLTLAARASSVLTGGPSWTVPLGRRDSTSASLSGSNNNIPALNSTFDTLLSKFADQGLDLTDMVALSGSHTIGFARCVSFKQRLYDNDGNNSADPSLNQVYATYLRTTCPISGADQILSVLDCNNTVVFDNTYFIDLVIKFGLLSSDQILFSGNNENSIELVNKYANSQGEFFKQFAISMIKMGNISPLTGLSGEIRRNCSKINTPNSMPINGQIRDDICFRGRNLSIFIAGFKLSFL